MPLHSLTLFRREGAGLGQQFAGQLHLADLRQAGSRADGALVFLAEAEGLDQIAAQVRHIRGLAAQIRVDGLDGVHERGDGLPDHTLVTLLRIDKLRDVAEHRNRTGDHAAFVAVRRARDLIVVLLRLQPHHVLEHERLLALDGHVQLLIQPQGGVIAKNRRAIHAHKLFVGTPNHTRERLVGILDHAALVGQDDAVHKRAVDAVEELLLLIGNLIQLEQFGAHIPGVAPHEPPPDGQQGQQHDHDRNDRPYDDRIALRKEGLERGGLRHFLHDQPRQLGNFYADAVYFIRRAGLPSPDPERQAVVLPQLPVGQILDIRGQGQKILQLGSDDLENVGNAERTLALRRINRFTEAGRNHQRQQERSHRLFRAVFNILGGEDGNDQIKDQPIAGLAHGQDAQLARLDRLPDALLLLQRERRGRDVRGKVRLGVRIGDTGVQEAGIGNELLQKVLHKRKLGGQLRQVVVPGGTVPGGFQERGEIIAQPVDFRGEQPEKIRADQPVGLILHGVEPKRKRVGLVLSRKLQTALHILFEGRFRHIDVEPCQTARSAQHKHKNNGHKPAHAPVRRGLVSHLRLGNDLFHNAPLFIRSTRLHGRSLHVPAGARRANGPSF